MNLPRMRQCPTCGHAAVPVPTIPLEAFDVTVRKMLARHLNGCPEDCWRFFETCFELAAQCDSYRALTDRLATRLSTNQQTLTSRFHRAGLPSPTTYVRTAWFVFVAHAMEDPTRHGTDIVLALGHSSGQAFHRSVKKFVGMSAAEFRSKVTGTSMVDLFLDRLVLPYLPLLRRFHPCARVVNTVDPLPPSFDDAMRPIRDAEDAIERAWFTVGQSLRTRRLRLGLGMRQLARIINRDSSEVARMELAHAHCTTMIRLCDEALTTIELERTTAHANDGRKTA